MINNYSKAIELMKNCLNAAVFMHTSPDGDAVGSCLSIYAFLKKTGKVVHCFSEDASKPVADKHTFLPYASDLNRENLHNYDLAIAVDCGDFSRLGTNCARIFTAAKKTILIDHHLGNAGFAQVNIIETSAASTTQIIYDILAQFNEELIDNQIADLLYAGLITDSGSFVYPSTSAHTFEVAAALLKKGADSAGLSQILMRDTDYKVFRLKINSLYKAKFYDNHTIGIININTDDLMETDTEIDDTEGFINEIINIESVLVAVSITEIKSMTYKVSFRSKNGISAEACARCFGGGGHKYAAGCKIFGYPEDVVEKILVAVRDVING
ncbi:MAG: DHH family phosphoesterase [Christensenellales bacterium]|jgi:phosphoesterase RecJ-like protein